MKRHVNHEHLSVLAAMIYPTVPNNQTAPLSAAVHAVDVAYAILKQSVLLAESHNATLDPHAD